MRFVLLFLVLAVSVSAASVRAPNRHKSSLSVELRVFSGTENPQWVLSPHSNSALTQRVYRLISHATSTATSVIGRRAAAYRLGYTGFKLGFKSSTGARSVLVYDARSVPELELALLETGVRAGAVPATVERYVRAELARVHLETVPRHSPVPAPKKRTGARDCTVPVVGPDNATIFDATGQQDDCGLFMADDHVTLNNCYAYGNDIVTDTFPQPGRGSGHKWESNTCDDMRAASERDGLVWANTTLPSHEPALGHVLALLIWPDTNFHWIRFDSSPAGHWSHKPGGTDVTEFDNNGDLIHDPSKQDFSPWSEFCGYMISVPSRITIN